MKQFKGKEKIDYKKMNDGEKTPPLNENSEVAQHMKSGHHRKEDMEITILGYKQNWWRRGVREAIHIRKHRPTLNKDQGRYNLTQIWTELIEAKDKVAEKRSEHVIGRNPTGDEGSASNFITEEDLSTGSRN